MKLFHQFCPFYLQFTFQKMKSIINRLAQNITDIQEMGLLFVYHTAIRRYADLTIRKGIKRIDSLIRRDPGSKRNTYLHLIGSEVFYFTNLDFSFLTCLDYRLTKSHDILAIGDLVDYDSLVISLFGDFRPYSNRASAFSVIISRHINCTTCLEMGVEMKSLSLKITYRGITQLSKMMRQYFTRQTYCDTLCTLSEKQRKFHG